MMVAVGSIDSLYPFLRIGYEMKQQNNECLIYSPIYKNQKNIRFSALPQQQNPRHIEALYFSQQQNRLCSLRWKYFASHEENRQRSKHGITPEE